MDKPALIFREDGTFTIIQFTDMHWTDFGEEDMRSYRLMCDLIDRERPDLIVYTGDLVSGDIFVEEQRGDSRKAIREVVTAAAEKRVPWAVAFGNHDREWRTTNEELLEELQTIPYCLAEAGPADISGVGNYVLEVRSATGPRPAALLYVLDSGNFNRFGGDPWIERDQIDWYVRQSTSYARRFGGPLPALAFFHIPLPEYDEVWDEHVCYGVKHERVCRPNVNTGFFAAMVQMGDVMGTFVGHDHSNDYCGELHGIRLCYGRTSGRYAGSFPRGARMIRLHEGKRGFDTWIRMEDGTVIDPQPEHEPNGRTIMERTWEED